jgi:Domain of unknown function (DUF5063)
MCARPCGSAQMKNPSENQEIADRFGLVARRFCEIVDAASDVGKTDLLLQVYRALPDLISGAMALPDVEPSDADAIEMERKRAIIARAQMSDAEWQQLYSLLKSKLDDSNLYYSLFDPTKDKQANPASLADDIADIYRELRESLILNDARSTPPEDSIFEWRLGFYSHWGKHAMDAFTAIHCLLEESQS